MFVKLFLAIALVVGFATLAEAACTGSSPTWTVTLNGGVIAVADVQTCVNSATVGDTINLPAGSGVWATTLSITKRIILAGAGIDVTFISGDGVASPLINITAAASGFRAHDFTMTVNGTATPAKNGFQIDGTGWRIDHIKCIANPQNTVVTNCVITNVVSASAPYGSTGLIDHFQFVDTRPLLDGIRTTSPGVSMGEYSSPLGLGDENAVYIEDSTWTGVMHHDNYVDCNFAGRFVVRFNTTTTESSWGAHATWQNGRACRRWELYGNSQSNGASFFASFFLRGGTGMVFNNVTGSGYQTGSAMRFDLRRILESQAFYGLCNGTSIYDGNLHVSPAADAGWPCRDQLGWATDSFQWTVAGSPPPQLSTPFYMWSNTIAGVPATTAFLGTSGSYIQANRDYYRHPGGVQTSPSSPFNGTSGVGVGILANRPTTCTASTIGTQGVGYWATDQGSWKTAVPPQGTWPIGEQGVLYHCIAVNTWDTVGTGAYTPYTYPHPLQGTIDILAPAAPTGVLLSKGIE